MRPVVDHGDATGVGWGNVERHPGHRHASLLAHDHHVAKHGGRGGDLTGDHQIEKAGAGDLEHFHLLGLEFLDELRTLVLEHGADDAVARCLARTRELG